MILNERIHEPFSFHFGVCRHCFAEGVLLRISQPKDLYKAPTDYAKPQKTIQSPRNTIQRPNRLYKAPKHYTKPKNIRQNLKITYKTQKY